MPTSCQNNVLQTSGIIKPRVYVYYVVHKYMYLRVFKSNQAVNVKNLRGRNHPSAGIAEETVD
jgi:hypothetical protein